MRKVTRYDSTVSYLEVPYYMILPQTSRSGCYCSFTHAAVPASINSPAQIQADQRRSTDRPPRPSGFSIAQSRVEPVGVSMRRKLVAKRVCMVRSITVHDDRQVDGSMVASRLDRLPFPCRVMMGGLSLGISYLHRKCDDFGHNAGQGSSNGQWAMGNGPGH